MNDHLIDEKPAYESEFGKGYAYCLGLFLCHDERRREYQKSDLLDASLWFNGAADHLFELIAPDVLPDDAKAEIEAFRIQCLHYRLENCTWDDAEKAINTAKRLLLEWDRFCNIPAEKGGWE